MKKNKKLKKQFKELMDKTFTDFKFIESRCIHCWHPFRGAIWMVIPSGHTLEQCCKCRATRTIHLDHYHRSHIDCK